jgi:hypothetical protein
MALKVKTWYGCVASSSFWCKSHGSTAPDRSFAYTARHAASLTKESKNMLET